MHQSGKISVWSLKFLFISIQSNTELIFTGLFLQNRTLRYFCLKNFYLGSTTMDMGRSRTGLREKLNFKTSLMKPWPTWLRILEWILAWLSELVHNRLKRPDVHTLAWLSHRTVEAELGELTASICLDASPHISPQQNCPWEATRVAHLHACSAVFYYHLFTFCSILFPYEFIKEENFLWFT